MTIALRSPAPTHAPTTAPTRRPATVLVPLVVGVCLTLLAAAYIQSLLVTGQQRLDGLHREQTQEQQLLQNERVDLAVEQSPATVAQRAEALGMVRADERIVIEPDTPYEPETHSEFAPDGAVG